jgi:hypothetical protein
MNGRMLCLAVVLAGCSTAPAPIPPPEGAPRAVVPASPPTTNATRVAEWRFFALDADATAPERFLVYGVDGDGVGVAEMKLAITRDPAGQPATAEGSILKNGAWGERFLLDYVAQTLAFSENHYDTTRLLWARAGADAQTTPPQPLGTQSVGVPYAGCDGCAVEVGEAFVPCVGFVGGLVGLAACPESAGVGCLVAPAIAELTGALTCPLLVDRAVKCDSTAKNTTCDSAAGYTAEVQKCPAGSGSGMDSVYTGKCLCADHAAVETMVNGKLTCVSPCPQCHCNTVYNTVAFGCGADYGPLTVVGTSELCDATDPPDGVVNSATGYCCPPFVKPARVCMTASGLGPTPY